jgi:hypothetical protein
MRTQYSDKKRYGGKRMDTCKSVPVTVHCVSSVNDRIEAVQDRITKRAYERWLSARTNGGILSECWDAAERELIYKPTAAVHEGSKNTLVEIACRDLDPGNIRVFITPWELLSLGPLNVAGEDRWLFHFLRFSRCVDMADAVAEYEPGTLSISVPFHKAVRVAEGYLKLA